MLLFQSDVTGNLIAHPASLYGRYNYTSPDLLVGTESYLLRGNYGDNNGFEMFGAGQLKLTGDGDKM